jgi:hypothetical protein
MLGADKAADAFDLSKPRFEAARVIVDPFTANMIYSRFVLLTNRQMSSEPRAALTPNCRNLGVTAATCTEGFAESFTV